MRGARVLILDEPTAVLTPQESRVAVRTLQQLVAEGLSIDLHQPQARRGAARWPTASPCCAAARWSPQLRAAGADKAQLAEAMVGRAVRTPAREPPRRRRARRGLRAARRQRARAPARAAARRREPRAARRRDRGDRRRGRQRPAGAGRPAVGLRARSTPARSRWPAARCRREPRAWVDAGVARIPEDRQARGRDRRPAGLGERAARALCRAGASRAGASCGATRAHGACAAHRRALRRARRRRAGSRRRAARCRAATCRS